MNRALVPTKALVASVCILTVVAAFSSYSARSTCLRPDPYDVQRARSRFAGLTSSLPPNVPIGYISDLPTSEQRGEIWRQAAQYALAPRLVLDSPALPWVIGNFRQPADFAQAGASHGLMLVRDFGNGVFLYRRERP